MDSLSYETKDYYDALRILFSLPKSGLYINFQKLHEIMHVILHKADSHLLKHYLNNVSSLLKVQCRFSIVFRTVPKLLPVAFEAQCHLIQASSAHFFFLHFLPLTLFPNTNTLINLFT